MAQPWLPLGTWIQVQPGLVWVHQPLSRREPLSESAPLGVIWEEALLGLLGSFKLHPEQEASLSHQRGLG